MAPLKDTFGEGWVESDDVAQGSLAAKSDASEHFKREKTETTEAHEVANNIFFKEHSMQSSKCQNLHLEGRLSEDNFNECNLKRESLEEAICKETINFGHHKSEHSMKSEEMHPLNNSMKDRGTLNKSPEDDPKLRQGGARGRETRTSLLKRVKSEASFIRGRVMLSTIECIHELMSTREGDNQINTNGEGQEKNEEKGLVEVEVTLKNWSYVEQKAIMEGKEMLLVCIPPWSLKNTNMHMSAKKSVDQPQMTLEMDPKSLGLKANNIKAGHMHQHALETIQQPPEKPSKPTNAAQTTPPPPSQAAHTKVSASNKNGMHPSKPQLKTAGRAGKPLKAFEELHKEVQANMISPKAKAAAHGHMKTSEVVPMREALLQRGQGGRMQANARLLQVKEVECECCGIGEECTTGYVEHVKGKFFGHWVCGLCAEAVHEERHRLGKGVPMEEAVHTHMNLCKQFSSMKKAGGPPHSPGVAHAVCHLLSRHLSDPTSPRRVPTTPIRPFLSRTISCLPSLSHKTPCSS